MKINIQTKYLHIYADKEDGIEIVLFIFGKEIHFTIEEYGEKMEGLSALFGDNHLIRKKI